MWSSSSAIVVDAGCSMQHSSGDSCWFCDWTHVNLLDKRRQRWLFNSKR